MDMRDHPPQDRKQSPSAHEAFDERQPFLPKQKLGSLIAEHFGGVVSPACRFRLPLPFHQRLTFRLRQEILELSDVRDAFTFYDPIHPVPLSWQIILNYLFEEKILASPRAVFEPPFNDEPKLFYIHLISSFDKELTDGHDPQILYNRGTSIDFEEAISKAIGELLERYPLTIYKQKELIRSSVRILEKRGIAHLNPAHLAGFSEEQKRLYPKRAWNEDDEFYWVGGSKLGGRGSILLPAQCIFWNYCYHSELGEPLLVQPITNGAAGSFTLEEAIISGIYELIQRDAFLIYWLTGNAPPRVDISKTKNKHIAALLELCQRYCLETVILNTTSDIAVPAFAAFILDHSGRWPAATVGGGCDLQPEKAIARAIIESLGVRHWLRRRAEQNPALKSYCLPDNYIPFQEEINQENRVALWANPKMTPRLSSFLQGPIQLLSQIPTVSFRSKGDELLFLEKTIRSLGPEYSVYFYVADHPIFKKIGYNSVRVIIPPLVPLYMKEHAAPLGAARLISVPRKLCWPSEGVRNHFPHPFP